MITGSSGGAPMRQRMRRRKRRKGNSTLSTVLLSYSFVRLFVRLCVFYLQGGFFFF